MSLPLNQPVRDYAPGSPERAAIAAEIQHQRANPRRILPVVGGRRIETGNTCGMFEPHAHYRSLGTYDSAGAGEAEAAIDAALRARHDWSRMSPASRRAVFLRAAELLAGPFNARLVAATMLQQSKTAYQSEIDASCELIDFLRFNVAFAEQLDAIQPISSGTERNRLEQRPLDGFVFAASPFNFTAIAGNLCIAPALMGNTVVWKPSERSVYSAAFLMDLFEAAGMPPGVINMLPADNPAEIGNLVLNHPALAGVHFTGSTAAFDRIWQTVGTNVSAYNSYPRLVGETGGKDFVLAHASADIDALTTALVRGAFDYQGQKCSAASRAYIPESLFGDVCEQLAEKVRSLTVGDVAEFHHFMGAVIDERAFNAITGMLDHAANTSGYRKIAGAEPDKSEGYFVPPTVIACDDPLSRLMTEEVFGPVLAVYSYPDHRLEETLELVDTSTPYALTGAIFAQDQGVIDTLSGALQDAAGNFYINDKPTGAVVGRQPFGGGRRSGTNDKAGSAINLLRWSSPRTVKETLVPVHGHLYPHMAE
ncbi:MAG: L-glutamate gamma-semialdehyde dehydrogenase [Hyphomonas sp.]|nr:L-glutamate gamma-semialdehyde dehydrogenase [Hyphomonas sp.]